MEYGVSKGYEGEESTKADSCHAVAEFRLFKYYCYG